MAVRGSTTWRFYAALMPIAAAGLIASLWFGPVRYLRRRPKNRATAGSSRATTPG